jgi:hypothetical protein
VRVPRGYQRAVTAFTLAIIAFTAYLLGMAGIPLLFAVVIGFVPVGIVVSSVARRLVPPTLEKWTI